MPAHFGESTVLRASWEQLLRNEDLQPPLERRGLTSPRTLRNEAAFSLERMIHFQRDTDWILLRTSSLDLILSSWTFCPRWLERYGFALDPFAASLTYSDIRCSLTSIVKQ
ncbi:hypothetical protein C8J56DRAFT_1051108 [Mycena floridula]|nr:hypothetical protein C8J56DRAFT_1051108 [Mycena floridula]